MTKSSPQPQISSRIHPLATLILGAVMIGFAPIFAKLAVNEGGVSPIAAGFWRMFFGAVFFMMIWRRSFKTFIKRPHIFKASSYLFFLPGLFFAGDLSIWHISFEYTSIANAALLANLASIFVPLIGYFFYKEKLSGMFFLGTITAFVGVASLLYAGHGNLLQGHSSSDQMFGDILGFITAFFYTGYLLEVKKVAGKFPTPMIMMFSSAWAAVILLGVVLVRGGQIFPSNAQGWVYILLLGFAAQMAGQGLVALSMIHLPASVSAVTLLLAPTASAFFSVFMLGQSLTVMQLVAGALVVAGIIIATYFRSAKV